MRTSPTCSAGTRHAAAGAGAVAPPTPFVAAAGRRTRIRPTAAALVFFCLLLVSGAGLLTAAAPPAHAFNQEITRKAKVLRLKSFKRHFGTAPQLLILGSSRAMRADPAQLRKALGIKGFNASVSSGTIPDAYAFLQLTKRRYPDARAAILFFFDVEVMRLSGYGSYLLSVPALVKGLPKLGPHRPAPRPVSLPRVLASGGSRGGRVLRPRFHADGVMVRWWHDVQWEGGRTTMAGVRFQKQGYGAIYTGHGWRGPSGSAKWFTAEIVRQANAMGVTPVFVLTPYHPELRRYIAGRGWTKAYHRVRSYLQKLAERYDMRLLDLTALKSFGGWPGGFYDGVHPRKRMMRVIVRHIIRKAGRYLAPSAPPSPTASPATTTAGAQDPATAAGAAHETHPALPTALARHVDSPLSAPFPGESSAAAVGETSAPGAGGSAAETVRAGGETAVGEGAPPEPIKAWVGAPSVMPAAWPTPPPIPVL